MHRFQPILAKVSNGSVNIHVHLALCFGRGVKLRVSLVAVRALSWACVKCALTAMAMAMDDSVTVSMGDEMRGVFSVIFLVNADVRSFQRNQ